MVGEQIIHDVELLRDIEEFLSKFDDNHIEIHQGTRIISLYKSNPMFNHLIQFLIDEKKIILKFIKTSVEEEDVNT